MGGLDLVNGTIRHMSDIMPIIVITPEIKERICLDLPNSLAVVHSTERLLGRSGILFLQ